MAEREVSEPWSSVLEWLDGYLRNYYILRLNLLDRKTKVKILLGVSKELKIGGVCIVGHAVIAQSTFPVLFPCALSHGTHRCVKQCWRWTEIMLVFLAFASLCLSPHRVTPPLSFSPSLPPLSLTSFSFLFLDVCLWAMNMCVQANRQQFNGRSGFLKYKPNWMKAKSTVKSLEAIPEQTITKG